MHRDVEALIGRLATDSKRLASFAADPTATLAGLLDEGFELNEVELEALAGTDSEALRRFAATLDPRLKKTPFAADRRLARGTNPTDAEPDKE